jgi:hypothetical protein
MLPFFLEFAGFPFLILIALSLTPSARLMGLYLLAASRSGKSRMLGRGIVWSDYYYVLP